MKLVGNQQLIHYRGNILVWRIQLAPGQVTRWHRDPFHRVTVVLKGDLLAIEFRDGGETAQWKIIVGEVDWSEPSDRVFVVVVVVVVEQALALVENSRCECGPSATEVGECSCRPTVMSEQTVHGGLLPFCESVG